MVRTLAAGAVHVRPESLEATLALAQKHGFRGLDFDIRGAAADISRSQELFTQYGVAPSVFGLPVEWRKDDATWEAGLAELPAQAKAAQALGCTRTATWVLPGSDERPTEENVEFHVRRFGPIAQVLADHGISLGLEYIGPKTLRDRFKYPFAYTQDGMLEVAAKIGPNVGLLVDCWHWYTSGGSVEDLRRLRSSDVVYVHVNDAPAGVAVDEQVDNVRRLPGETGVIDIAGFLGALRAIGYDGPAAAEPFDDTLKDLGSAEERLERVRASMERVGL